MNTSGGKRTSTEEVLTIVDRFLHGYTVPEICKETGKSRGNVQAYITYYEYLNGRCPNRNSFSVSKDGADAICEKYGFEKDYSVIHKWTPKQAKQKPEEELQEQLMITEPNEKPVTVGCFTGEAKQILDDLAGIRKALYYLNDKQDETNKLLHELIGLLK